MDLVAKQWTAIADETNTAIELIHHTKKTGGADATGDNVGVVTAWKWPDPLDGVTGTDFDNAAAAIRAGRWKESVQAKDWVGWPIARALGFDLHGSKSEKAKVKGLIQAWIKAGSLVVVEEKDDHRELKNFVRVAADA